MTETTKRLVGAAVLAIWASTAGAGSKSRSCEPGEELQAKNQLEAAEGVPALRLRRLFHDQPGRQRQQCNSARRETTGGPSIK